MIVRKTFAFIAITSLLVSLGSTVQAEPTAEKALGYVPVQTNVSYETPEQDEVAKCKIAPESANGQTAWVVRGANNQILRKFVDTNADNQVDQWRYYSNGLEVYRDIDADFNRKADQYRWLGTEGTRWGIDQDEDGRIDSWKMISAEEVSLELVTAIREKDLPRFKALLVTSRELESLGLGAQLKKEVGQRISKAPAAFTELTRTQNVVQRTTSWLDFGGLHPGIVPAGTTGTTKDIVVYENAVAMVESKGNHGQIQIGTMIQVGPTWKLISAPAVGSKQGADGLFFQVAQHIPATQQEGAGSISEEQQELIAKLEDLDQRQSRARTTTELRRLNGERADLLEKLAAASTGNDRDMWLRQLADSISAASQSGEYPDGTARLKKLFEEVKDSSKDKSLIAHCKFCYMTADYSDKLQAEDADFPKVQEKWISDLEEFVADYPKTPDTAEVMVQLATAEEFSGNEEKAAKWYTRIVRTFPDSTVASKAKGAQRRLNSVGKSIAMSGRTADGRKVDLTAYRGKTVLLHYWASWFGPSEQDMKLLKQLQSQYARKDFVVVGVNLDNDRETLMKFLRTNKINWPQMFEPGGLDSPLANQMGIFTLPVMVLIDESGKVLNRNIHLSELEGELRKRLR